MHSFGEEENKAWEEAFLWGDFWRLLFARVVSSPHSGKGVCSEIDTVPIFHSALAQAKVWERKNTNKSGWEEKGNILMLLLFSS